MSKKEINLIELRIKIDQINEKIISGLKQRSRYPVNQGIYSKDFIKGHTWFLYRLKKEQDIDSQFGRFLYSDQAPMFFKKEELDKPVTARKAPKINGLTHIKIDKSKKILEAYREIIKKICNKKEDENYYGETAKLDVDNILAINERVLGLGEQVAEYKMESDPDILKEKDRTKIRAKLVIPQREKEVLDSAKEIAKKYGLGHEEDICKFIKEIIDITTDSEVEYIIKKKELSLCCLKKRC